MVRESLARAKVTGAEIKMWVAWFFVWGILGWGLNTAFVVKSLAPESGGEASTLLGFPVHLLYMVVVGALVVLVPTAFIYSMDLEGLEIPETERVYDPQEPLVAAEDERVAPDEDETVTADEEPPIAEGDDGV